jgi:hypothetical protein
MPRANRRRVEAPRPGPPATLAERVEEFRGEPHVVRSVTGSSEAKAYRCPGCDQEIRSGTPHVVAWPQWQHDATDRRHWHSSCWQAREHRAPR